MTKASTKGRGRHRVARAHFGARWPNALVSHPKTVLLFWLAAVIVSIPFALRLPTVLSQQGASTLVPGTASASAATLISSEFPDHSERETEIVISAAAVTSPPLRALQADIDRLLANKIATGSVLRTNSAYTIFMAVTTGFVQQQLDRSGALTAGSRAVADMDALARAEQLPADLAALLHSAAGAAPAALPGVVQKFVLAADWTRFPLPAPTTDVLSGDHRAAIVMVSFTPGGPDPNIQALRADLDTLIHQRGLTQVDINVTGEIPLLQDTYAKAEADNSKMEYVAYVIIFVVLLFFFRAVLPAVITVAIIGLAMNVSQAWLFALGHSVHLTQFTSTIMTFVMLGAGIDYSMLLSSRYRQERIAGHPVPEAVVRATRKAGESMLLAGLAVVLAFSATLISPVDWIPPLGYGGLIGIPIILLAALTITPCALVLLGDRFFLFGFRPLGDMEKQGVLSRALRRMVRISSWCPVVVVLAFVLATIPLVGIIGTHTLSANPVALSPDTDARRGAEAVTAEWGEATLFPTVVVGRLDDQAQHAGELTPTGQRELQALVQNLEAIPGVARVDSPIAPIGNVPALTSAELVRDFLSGHGTARIVVRLAGDPYSTAAGDTVQEVENVVAGSHIAPWLVGGTTAVDRAYNSALQTSFWKMIVLVSLALIVLLTFALKSVLIPIRLVLTIMMSNIWAIAITVTVFLVWRGDPVINDLPIFLVILMMGLGMDYEIFLITRVRDHVRHGADDAKATALAVVDTGRVITSAGLVMAGSLGTMMLSSTLMLQEYGLGLGSAVLLDATLVRMLFVPASLLLFRRLNWWYPRLLRRRLVTA